MREPIAPIAASKPKGHLVPPGKQVEVSTQSSMKAKSFTVPEVGETDETSPTKTIASSRPKVQDIDDE